MLIYKLTLTISGNNFSPNDIVSKLSNHLDMVGYHLPTDENDYDQKPYGFGTVFFMHPKIFCVLGKGKTYEEDFIAFLEKHYALFINAGANEFDIYTEVYYSGDQCNFEIFTRPLLKRMNSLHQDIALPVSIYRLKKKQIKRLLEDAPAQNDE